MNILFFALKRKILSFFTNAESAVKLVLNIAYILLIVFYGAMIGFMMDLMEKSDEIKIEVSQVKSYVLLGYGLMMVLFEFLPSYKNRSSIIPKIYAVSAAKRWLVNIIYDFFKPTNLAFLGSLILIDVVSKTYTSFDLLRSLLFFFNVYLFLYLLKTFIEEKHRLKFVKWLWAILIIAFLAILTKFDLDATPVLIGLITALIFQVLCSVLLEKNITELSNNRFSYNFVTNSAIPAIYWAFIKKPKSRTGYFAQLILKVGFTLFTTATPVFKSVFFGDFIWLLYVAPLTLFTYMANNAWGFFSAIWLNAVIGNSNSATKKYFQILTIPLLIDCVLTFIILLVYHKLDLNLSLFYFSAVLLLLANGLVFTHYKPLAIDSGLSFTEMKTKVNSWSILLSMLIVVILSVFKNYIWVMLPIFLISIILFYYIQKEIKQKRFLQYSIFGVLRGE